jgi:signal transduction histidine kinase
MNKLFSLSATMIALFLMLSSTISAQQQKADSLINVLNTQKLTPAKQLVLYNDICNYLSGVDSEKLFTYAEKGLALAEKENDKLMISNFLSKLGVSNTYKENYDTALSYYEKALIFAQDAKNEKVEADLYVNIAIIYSYQSKHKQALENYIKALSFYEKTAENKEGAITVLYNIASTHLVLNNNDRAIYYLEQAKALADELDYVPLVMTYVYTSFGNIYFGQEDDDKALEYYLKALETSRSNEFHAGEIDALLSIAKWHIGLRKYSQAEKYVNEALQLAEGIGSRVNVAKIRLAEVYLVQKRYQECDVLASTIYEETDSTDFQMLNIALSNIIKANIYLGNKDKAASFFEKYKDAVMLYSDESLHQSLSAMEVKYETEKKELRITAMEKDKVFYMTIGIIGGSLLLTLLFLFIILHRLAVNKRKLAEQHLQQVATQSVLDGETAERTRLARDLHDGLGGMLSVVKLNLDDLEHLQNARDMLDQSINELRRVAHHMMPESLLRYGLRASLEDFCLSIPNAKFHYFGNESRLDDRTEILIYRCTYELVNNAIKYSKASTINVQLVQEPDRISLTVQDDGCGFDTETTTSGMGLDNLRVRVAAGKGNMNIYSSPGKGTEAYVELRLKKDN